MLFGFTAFHRAASRMGSGRDLGSDHKHLTGFVSARCVRSARLKEPCVERSAPAAADKYTVGFGMFH